ncbi:MAG: hypothetical protein ACI4T4_01030 [Limosilactobacillus sp.]
MESILNYPRKCWNYIIHHHWSKDILRANLLYIFLVVVYNLCHFSLAIIHWHVFTKFFWLMNLCLFFKLALDLLDRALRQH